MSSTKNITVNHSLGYRLKQTQHALRIHMDEALRALNLTTPQYAVLAQLQLRPGISNAALARAAFITAQSMHGIVSNLEKRELVQRSKNPQHGRILCTELTTEGHKVIQQCHQLIRDVEDHMTVTLTKEKKDALKTILNECFNNLNALHFGA